MSGLTTITYPGAGKRVRFGYDNRGRRHTVTDQNLNVTTYDYDDADRLIKVTDAQTPTPGITQYTYDTENNLTDIFDALSNHTHFTYINGLQTLSKTTFQSGFIESYGFNNLNALTSKTDRNGKQ